MNFWQHFARALAVLLIVTAVSVLPGRAQDTAELNGIVYDSTSMGPLAGARVGVIGTSSATVAGPDGRFTLEGIVAGIHWVSFFHPRLQELGVSPPSRQVTFRSGETVTVALAVPSETTLLAGWCVIEQPGPGYGSVSGIVTDSLTGVPMPGALVTLEAAVTPRFGLRTPTEVKTDDGGYFRICNVPAETEMNLQPHFGRSSGRTVVISVGAGSGEIQDLMMLVSTEGTLSGYVEDFASGEPVQGASVMVAGTEGLVLTDEEGRFIMDDLPPGRHLVTTDHIAFEQRTDSVTIFSEEVVDIEVRLAVEALELDGLVVTARTRFGRTSLLNDAKRADFISREEIEALLPRTTATVDLLRNVHAPGLRIREISTVDAVTGVPRPGLCIEVSRRSGGQGCAPAAVFINDVPVPYPEQAIIDMDPNFIDRIEVLNPVDASFRYGTIAGNGAIVIYTR
ncbi:MAG: carboxypeptidase regulatory-like domain-containing protein [Gemmatimonadota bacterium]|nr:carboxypeptidase regulatory-like domain-containing protein [Gemmatimonadota bacterium]